MLKRLLQKTLKKMLFFSVTLIMTAALDAGEKVCQKCEEIRKYNAEHHQNFEYFEDYLSLQENDPKATAERDAHHVNEESKDFSLHDREPAS